MNECEKSGERNECACESRDMTVSRPEHNGDEFSYRHPKMKNSDRAKIFAPFSALRGLDEAVDEAAGTHEVDGYKGDGGY